MLRCLWLLLVTATFGAEPQIDNPVSASEARSKAFLAAADAAIAALNPALQQAHGLLLAGEVDEANRLLVDSFPEQTRSAAEAFVLGNLLFNADPEQSYALHRRAVETAPDVAEVLFEWALQLHRNGEYAQALESYRRVHELWPEFAVAYGLAAECALRLGAVRDAAQLWQRSEAASVGTIQKLEALICAVNGKLHPDRERKQLRNRVRKWDEGSAVALILLDADWVSDWWNSAPQPTRLRYDVELVRSIFATPSAELRSALAVAECVLLPDDENAKSGRREILRNAGYLFDPAATLPSNGSVLLAMFRLTEDVLKDEERRTLFGERVLQQARQDRDEPTYRVAAHLYRDTEQLRAIDQEAWEVTGDARFAASLLLGDLRRGALTLSHPLVQKARQAHPEDSHIMNVVLTLAAEAEEPLEPYLVSVLLAEYHKLSTWRPGVALPRPSATMLRRHFRALDQVLHSADESAGAD